MKISDERLARLIEELDRGLWRQEQQMETMAALRELQRRRNPPQLDWQAGFVDISQCPPES